jgi:hypothetical protein
MGRFLAASAGAVRCPVPGLRGHLLHCLELADMGRVIARSLVAAAPGDEVYFDTASGEIAGTAEDDGLAVIPGARFAFFSVEAGGLAVIQLDPGVVFRVEVPGGEPS